VVTERCGSGVQRGICTTISLLHDNIFDAARLRLLVNYHKQTLRDRHFQGQDVGKTDIRSLQGEEGVVDEIFDATTVQLIQRANPPSDVLHCQRQGKERQSYRSPPRIVRYRRSKMEVDEVIVIDEGEDSEYLPDDDDE